MAATPRPYTLIAELTYRCPLRCAYCSNPTGATGPEIGLATWLRVLEEAAGLGVVAVHFTGGEPLLHPELERLVARAAELDLYTSLITSGLPPSSERLCRFAGLGLDHVQVSVQSTHAERAVRIAGVDALEQKRALCRSVARLGLPLTVNVVLHRDNIDEIDSFVAFARDVGAERLELANAQWHGFALRNRSALLPSAAQIARARAAAERLRGSSAPLQIAFIMPDHHAGRPRACMDGWARRYLVVGADGAALPCHAARELPFPIPLVIDQSLSQIWNEAALFRAFRGDSWMPPACRTCDRKDHDFGGCRCQAFALTGDAYAVDPACERSAQHASIREAVSAAGSPHAPAPELRRLPMHPR